MTREAPYDARAVANYILKLANARSFPMTQLSIYKILYFAHGWYLSKTGAPLVAQEFEAWERGPVVKVVRDEFKEFGKAYINKMACKLDIYTGEISIVEPNLNNDDRKFIEDVFQAYHVYSAWQLSEMTHEQGSPWDVVWNSAQPLGRLGLRLRNEEIKSHFDGISRRFQLS